MAKLVTERRIEAAYAMLLRFPPFDRWKLPPPERVKFVVMKGDTDHAVHDSEDMVIGVNPDTHTTLYTLLESVAHEMAHMRQEARGELPDNASKHHNKAFQRIARMICKDLGFDPQRF